MTKRIPLEWVSRERLRLRLVGGLVALHDARGEIPAGGYVVDADLGEIALLADPHGDVTAEVEDEAPAPDFPAYRGDEA